MQYKQFVQNHREDWTELEALITSLHKKRDLSPEKLERFQSLYQKVTQHLSYSQTYYPQEETTGYLNELVGKAHNMLYQDQVSSLQQLKQFFGSSFVQLFTEQWKAVLIAMALFMLGGIGAFLSVMQDPMHMYAILPEQIATAIDPEQIGGDGAVNSPVMSASIMSNNIRVAILAFASGITFGILTVYLLIYNGIIVGALAAFFWHYGRSYDFWAYIVPHGIIELTAIFIAGGAGLLMGYKLLVPGDRPRSYQLKQQALRSVKLFLGTIPLFVIAGIIEGFITPAPISLEAKYVFAFTTLIGLILYITAGKLIYQKRHQSQLQ
ncbi:stage II sporulation protein M [Pontibacillus marinus]|uniref:Membrane protein n=1 Tax=Pontibacillus marinus BH030004 = DSM 16465 TaxID=1385511 RepID=A0A0A5GHS1_9BACI|nr:stage II sporulation protein M [Pontibacillus marinus]KGX90660.1 membrane protein [Pontibacillus marinus BH030004 = DSM 16465]